MANYIRFDWAMKRLLRNKANYAVLEGLLTTLLKEKVTICKLLESESNQEDEYDKYNRVDMLAENSKGELVLIEVQYAFHVRLFFRVFSFLFSHCFRQGHNKAIHPAGMYASLPDLQRTLASLPENGLVSG